jgi:signal transduction histidine kinase
LGTETVAFSPRHGGRRLIFSFFVLISLILVGNLLLIWQFRLARLQADRLTAENQQLIAILRLQESIRMFHQRLDELAQTHDARRMHAGAEPLRRSLLEDVKVTRNALAGLPAETRIDPAFLPTLEAIEVALPSQLEAIVSLAGAGDWDAVRRRLGNELRPLEAQTAALVKRIDDEVSVELIRAKANMEEVQQRIFVLVPATALATFSIAAFFGWALTRRIADLRAEERLDERTRIARELHDTLLQGVIGASMQLQVAGDHIPTGSPGRPLYDRALQLMGQVIEDGRNAVHGFRSIEKESDDLAQAFASLCEELGREKPFSCRIAVAGHPHRLRADVRHEVYCIGRETLVNAFRHSAAATVEVQLEYSVDRLRLLLRDDGRGIDPEVLDGGREGHWGLSGMHERAEKIGAVLRIRSGKGAGTEVDLSVPAHNSVPPAAAGAPRSLRRFLRW